VSPEVVLALCPSCGDDSCVSDDVSECLTVDNMTLWLDCERRFCADQDPQCDLTSNPTVGRNTTDFDSQADNSSRVEAPTEVPEATAGSTGEAASEDPQFYAPDRLYEAGSTSFTDYHPPHVLAIVLTAIALSLLIAGGMAYHVWTNFRQTGKNRGGRTRVATREDSVSGLAGAPEGWDVEAEQGNVDVLSALHHSIEEEPESDRLSDKSWSVKTSRLHGDEGEVPSLDISVVSNATLNPSERR
jgi:hypothetical protein